MIKIPFNKPFFAGNEMSYIQRAVENGKISGNGIFTKKCHEFFQMQFGFPFTLLTSSCTDALEMSALLCEINPGDEVIAPAYAFVSTVNAFALRGAKIVFADSQPGHPNIDPIHVRSLITEKTKAIVIIHYAGIACDMDEFTALAKKHNLFLIEDAAQAIDSYYKERPLGTFGDLAAFSFHETKNIISGEGGMLVVNNPELFRRSEILWEKGTNRVAFSKGEVNKYQWVDIGSSFLPSEITAAFLFAQLEHLKDIQDRRKVIWDKYYQALKPLALTGKISLPLIPEYASNNAHIFYICCESQNVRDKLISFINAKGVHAVFHYLSLNNSPYYLGLGNKSVILPHAERFEKCLIRLPLYVDLTPDDQQYIIACLLDFFK